jgi:hypothetical protein
MTACNSPWDWLESKIDVSRETSIFDSHRNKLQEGIGMFFSVIPRFHLVICLGFPCFLR